MTIEEKIEAFRHSACEICPAKKVCTKQEDIETCEIFKKAKESESYAVVYNAGLKDAELSKKYWHEVAREGIPAEDGYYTVVGKGWEKIPYTLYSDCEIKGIWDCIAAWHKIPEYEEQK